MVNEVERRLLVLIARLGCRHAVFDSPPQYHYTPRTTPEGSGAAIACNLLNMACKLHNEMATFSEAQVSQKNLSSKP